MQCRNYGKAFAFHSDQMTKISGQFLISAQFQDKF